MEGFENYVQIQLSTMKRQTDIRWITWATEILLKLKQILDRCVNLYCNPLIHYIELVLIFLPSKYSLPIYLIARLAFLFPFVFSVFGQTSYVRRLVSRSFCLILHRKIIFLCYAIGQTGILFDSADKFSD